MQCLKTDSGRHGRVITDYRAGFAVGIAAHGIGTARAFQVDEIPAFSLASLWA